MGVREAREPALTLSFLLDDREHALGSEVVDHVQVAVAHLDQPIVDRHVVAIDDVLRRRLAEVGNRRAVPVLALFPDVPGAVRVEAVQHVRPEANGIGSKSYSSTFSTPEKMCSGMIQAAFQRTEKIEWNLELGLWSVKWTVWSSSASTVSTWVENAPLQVMPGVSIWVCDGEDDVVGGELLAVAPVDVVAQVHRHLGEIGVVLRRAGRQRVLGHAVDSGIGVDEPERVHHQLMQAGRQSATDIDPDVEPAGIARGAPRGSGESAFAHAANPQSARPRSARSAVFPCDSSASPKRHSVRRRPHRRRAHHHRRSGAAA